MAAIAPPGNVAIAHSTFNFRGHANYVYRANWSYYDYLQARHFSDQIVNSISERAASIIGCVDASAERVSASLQNNGERLSAIEGALTEANEWHRVNAHLGLATVEQLVELRRDLGAINATLDWGMREILSQFGQVNDHLEALVQLARTPSQKWAYEQFAIAQDCSRRGLDEGALESVVRARQGHGSNIGYSYDHRFYVLEGMILLGRTDHRHAA